MTTPEERIIRTLEIARKGATDGAHHKQWVIDQMVRALTGCPDVVWAATNKNGHLYHYTALGESEEYLAWLESFYEVFPNTRFAYLRACEEPPQGARVWDV